MDEIKEYYIEGEHYDWVTHPRRLEKIFHRLREQETAKLYRKFKSGSTILDAGCGTGLISRSLNGTVVGLDINVWNLERARVHAPQVNFIAGDIENLPLTDGKFDTIVCTETLEHLKQPEKAIGELDRVLKPGGRLIGSVPHRHVIWNMRKFLLTTCPVSEPFHHNYTVPEVKSMLSGFKTISISKGLFGLNVFFVVERD
jgi:ubiquinone/menaquinone biosynthesis C-methylase UbiE